MSLLGASEIRQLAEKLDVRPTKKLGQNFVIDPNTIRKIVNKANLEGTETVVEIGPGLGSLTLGLLEKVDSVVAVEIDSRLSELLPETVSKHSEGKSLEVINADALKVTELPDCHALVANLPYNISVPVLLHFLESFPSIKKGLVLVQSEVARRLVAKPNDEEYGIPSLKLAWWADARLAGGVSRRIFWPVPNVDSELVYFERKQTLGDRTRTFELIDRSFGTRRKTLAASLKSSFSYPVAEALAEAGLSNNARPEQLGLNDFLNLARLEK